LAGLKAGNVDGLKVRTGRLQNLVSSSCIEHLDFLSTEDQDFQAQSFQQLQHASIGYQSLTDVPQAVAYAEDTTDFRKFQHHDTGSICSVLPAASLKGKTTLLGILLPREGLGFHVDGRPLSDHINSVLNAAASVRAWSVVRTCTALLSKEVESISPYITTVLVYGKQVTLGTGDSTVVIDKPVQPAEVHDMFYTKNLKTEDLVQAVLQQEVMLYCGKLIGAHPHLFRGILNLRVAWLVQAMEYYRQCVLGKSEKLIELSPNEVYRLLWEVLSMESSNEKQSKQLSPKQIRFIDGCLGRTPDNFYDKVWLILEKTPGGLHLFKSTLPQYPTISELCRSEMSFARTVQELLATVTQPEYSQVMAELLCIMATILQRNPELEFSQAVKLDGLVQDAGNILRQDAMGEQETVCCCSEESCLCAVYCAKSHRLNSSLARAVVNLLLARDTRGGGDGGEAGCRVA